VTTLTKGRVRYEFRQLVKRARVDRDGGDHFPPPPKDFDKNPGGWQFPRWSLPPLWFLPGVVFVSFTLLAPISVPLFALALLVTWVVLAVVRRWP